LIGSADGPWYLSFDPASFKNGETGLSLAAGTTYTVSETGAFADAAGHPDGALSASFTTAASSQVADPVAVVYTPAGAAPTVRTSANLSVASGQAVARGTQLSFTVPTESGYTVSRSVTLGGAAADETDLSDVTLTGDLEVYITREPAALSGQASVSGTAAYGEPLSGSVTGANQPDEANWTFTWVRRDTTNGDTLVARGGSETGYTPSVLDIGETIRLEVTDSVCSGTLYAETAVIAKAAYAGPAVLAPTTQTLTETSVTLVSTDGYEYSLGGSVWQSESAFTGLTSGETYEFYQRVAATDTTLASAAGLKTAVTTVSPLTGDVSITGTAQSGKTLTASLTGSNNTGELTYTWKRGTSTVGIGAQYTAEAADIGQTLTVEVTSSIQTGTLTASTAAVTKAVCSQSTPAAPTLASATATSITLTATNGYQYSLGGVSWQDTTTFHNLTTGTSYTFYQRVAETDTEFCSAAGPAATLSTLPGLTGTIMSSGEARYGMTIVASLSDSNNTGTLTYTWKRGTVTVGTGTTYTVSAIDIGNQLSLEVTSSMQGGSVTRSYGTVAKAYYFGDTPDAPTRYSRSSTKVILNSVDGCEYSKNGTTWQDSTTFSGLTAGTTYSFYQRYEATATMEASPASEALSVTTSSSSSTSSDSSDDSDDSDATPTPDSSTSLYSYTLTSDNTRILYSTMKSLAAGNETSDVTIKQSGVEITFLKGTMTDSYSQLWYDFGVTVNDSIREQTAKSLGGDAYVATVHFNYEGTLPGQASIRISLGAANAGKTLSYYRLEEDDTLTFLQTAVADSAGWATVTQESCSDYVFLDSEKAAAAGAATATPADTPSVSPTPAGDSADADGWNLTSDVWFIAAIILLAVALIIGGIWLYTKNRDSY